MGPASVIVLAACVVGLAGCGGGRPQWLTGGPTTDRVPGLLSPAERIEALRKLGDRVAGAELPERQRRSEDLAAAYATEEDPLVREALVRAAARCGTPRAASLIRVALNDSDPKVRIAACEAWGRLGGPDAVSHLATVLSADVNVDVRLAAARALGSTGDPSAVVALGPALEDEDPAMQFQAVQSLKTLSNQKFGNDVNRWRQFVSNRAREDPERFSLADRPRRVR